VNFDCPSVYPSCVGCKCLFAQLLRSFLRSCYATFCAVTPPDYPRRAMAELERKMRSSRVVIVNGPRQAGKSWLLRQFCSEVGGRYESLDVSANLRAARTDPAGFVQRDGRPLFIDEVQRGGNALVLAVKAAVDLSNDRGQFVLAGSTRFLAEPRLSESLAGRARFVDLWGLSQAEIDGTVAESFIDVASRGFEPLAELGRTASNATRPEVMQRLVRGGFPEAVQTVIERDRMDWFADYIRTIAQRDIAELSRMTDRIDLLSVLRLLAARSAGELNMSDLANDAGLGRDTARRYVPLIEAIFLLHRLPGWGRNLASATKQRPKIHLTDSGLAAWLARVRLDDLARPGHHLDGALLESFVVGELLRIQSWSEQIAQLCHWRDKSGREVDVLLDFGPSALVGIEVKAAVDVSESDFRHLIYMRDRVGDSFKAGVVLHLGDRVRSFGDRLLALPVSSLWANNTV
jgi:uncharacterized protein